MELVYILVPIFVFVLAKTTLEQRAAARSERVHLIEEALKNPNLDRATLESLTWQLTGARPPKAPGGGRTMAMVLAIGWITLFTGIGLLGIGGIVHDDDLLAGGFLVTLIGFGVVTYPFALRELEARRQA